MIKHAMETQKPILDMLHRSMENGRLSHAYLISGDEGAERLGVALYFACMLYCNEVCLECKNCKDIMSFNHLNVIYVTKQQNKTEIVKEQIENLKEEISKTSLVDGPRIYIIDDAAEMNSTCANKLLKFIEEPYDNIYAVLVTKNKDSILSTIKSRCQIINLLPMNKKEVINKLIEEMDESEAKLLAEIYGSVEECKKAHDKDIFASTLKHIKNIGLMMSKKFSNLTLYFKEYIDFYKEKEDCELFLKMFLLYLIEADRKSTELFTTEKNTFENISLDLKPIIDLVIKSQRNLRYNIDRTLLLLNLFTETDRRIGS